jgi:hypothetical protein
MLRTPFYQTRGGKTQCPRWNVSGVGWDLWLRAQCQGILDVVVGQGTLDGPGPTRIIHADRLRPKFYDAL